MALKPDYFPTHIDEVDIFMDTYNNVLPFLKLYELKVESYYLHTLRT